MYNYVYDSTRKTPLSMYYASVCAPFSNNDARVVSVEPAAASSFYVANRSNSVCASIFIWIYTKAIQLYLSICLAWEPKQRGRQQDTWTTERASRLFPFFVAVAVPFRVAGVFVSGATIFFLD